MSEAIGTDQAALPRPMGHRRDPQHRVPALPAALAHPAGHRGRGRRPLHPAAVPDRRPGPTRGEVTSNGVVIETATWAVGIAGLVAALAGVVMFLVLTGAITRAVAAEVAGEDPSLEQSYRFGFHRLGSVLLVSVLVGLATIGGLIVFIIPGIYIGVRLCVSIEALVVEGPRDWAMGRSWEWSATTGGTPSAPWWWLGCSPGW